ncbi:MAG: hypothetical protein ACI3ZN_08560, partial [Candidatus Cryptobacteroides sp.]
WNAHTTASWMEISLDKAEGTVTLTVNPTEDIEAKTGEIIIWSDIEQVGKVTVSQDGNGIIYDRSSLKTMGLKGKVRHISDWFDPIHMWEAQPGFLKNLEFDSNGMLTHFEFTYTAGVIVDFAFNMTYDEQNRLIEIHGTSSDTNETYYPNDYVISFQYGNHGKYVNLDNLFEPIDTWGCLTMSKRWMPAALKDLTQITLTSDYLAQYQPSEDGKGINHCEIIIGEYPDDPAWPGVWQAKYRAYFANTATDNDGNEIRVPNPEGTDYHLNYYEFTGPYTTKMVYDIDFVGIVIPATAYFDIDPRNGLIYTQDIRNDEVFVGHSLLYKRFHGDFRNSCFQFNDDMGTYYRMSIEYNDRYEVSRIYNASRKAEANFTYKYDENGNWTDMTIDTNSPLQTPPPTSRSIKYYR